jgi:hypothetical protein
MGAMNVAYKIDQDGQQRIMNHLADCVFELSDAEILAEVRDTQVNPQEEADRMSLVLRQAVNTWELENERVSMLGHTINSNCWRCVEGIYQNYCLSCGLVVSFSTATQRMEGSALGRSCPARDQHTTRQRQASR